MKSSMEPHKSKILFLFLFANYILSLYLGWNYLSFAPTWEDPTAWVYTRLAYLSTLGIFYLLLWLILWPPIRWIHSNALLYLLPPLGLFLFQTFLVVDVQIYGIFRFHINGLVINTLTTEGAGDSVQLGGKTVVTFIIYLLFLITLESVGLWGLIRYFKRRQIRSPSFVISRKSPIFILILLSVTILADKGIFAFANFYDMTNITRYQKLFPLYLPLFADRTIEKYLGWKKPDDLIAYLPKTSLLDYPSKEFRVENDLTPINIVWITVESWRFDMMNSEITPSIHAFSRKSMVFENHYSAGNATRFGIFGMFYGIYGSYWHQFLAERRAPVFLDILQHQGYDFKILSSTLLTYPEFRKTAFVQLSPSSIEDHLSGDGGVDRDLSLAKRFDIFLRDRNTRTPFFSFMFLDSPHAPYRYPEAFAKFQPTAKDVNYFQVRKAHAQASDGIPLLNRYRNSVFFTDSVVGTILGSLEKRRLLDSTVVVITGDHGEEFYETGYYGHNSTYSDYQIKVPLILYIPGNKPSLITRMSSHLDLVPTMLSLMGSRLDPGLYSHGHSLLGDGGEPYVVSSGWDTFSVIDPEARVILSTETYNARSAEVRIGPYQLASDPKPLLSARSHQLLEVTKNIGMFLK